jgi:glycosyltransferase involved in cell wall biosynthesis
MLGRVPPPPPLIDVVIPALDHAATLGPLLRDLPHRAIRSVVVVDRASTDRTAEVARDAGALVLREPSGGYGAACLRAQAHFSSLPRVPDVIVFVPGDRRGAASAIPALVAPIAERGIELVLGIEAGRRNLGDKLVTGLIDTVYRHRWSGVGPVRAMRFPALIALGMSDRSDGWDVEMLVRAVKLGLSCDEIAVAADAQREPRALGRALLHILRHATMR